MGMGLDMDCDTRGQPARTMRGDEPGSRRAQRGQRARRAHGECRGKGVLQVSIAGVASGRMLQNFSGGQAWVIKQVQSCIRRYKKVKNP
jgi:hypothetical protein